MTSQPPVLPLLPPNTIVPTNEDLFVPYLSKLYLDISSAVNAKDSNFYPMAITSTAQNILNLPNFGAYIACVSGVDPTLPTITVSLCKASNTASGSVAVLGSQVGTGAWATYALTVSSTATNFQIRHNNTGVIGNFNLRIMGTQGFV